MSHFISKSIFLCPKLFFFLVEELLNDQLLQPACTTAMPMLIKPSGLTLIVYYRQDIRCEPLRTIIFFFADSLLSFLNIFSKGVFVTAIQTWPACASYLFIYLFIRRESKRTFECQMAWKKCKISTNVNGYKFYINIWLGIIVRNISRSILG